MATDSQRCVDELLIKQNEMDQLVCKFEETKLEDTNLEDLNKQARNLVSDAQGYIDNNKQLIPAYCLKKTSDLLRKLQAHLDKPKKAGIQFKFKAPKDPAPPQPAQASTPEKKKASELDDIPDYEDSDEELHFEHELKGKKEKPIIQKTEIFGFSKIDNERLTLSADQVKDRDISLIDLDRCDVVIHGIANTVYIRNVWRSDIVICLATRAIKISDCYRCHIKLVCQQLRIDTSSSMLFNNFVSARTMLESSEDIEFKCLDLDSIEGLPREKLSEMFDEAGLDIEKNNWKCIDDFDHLCKTTPSNNFVILE